MENKRKEKREPLPHYETCQIPVFPKPAIIFNRNTSADILTLAKIDSVEQNALTAKASCKVVPMPRPIRIVRSNDQTSGPVPLQFQPGRPIPKGYYGFSPCQTPENSLELPSSPQEKRKDTQGNEERKQKDEKSFKSSILMGRVSELLLFPSSPLFSAEATPPHPNFDLSPPTVVAESPPISPPNVDVKPLSNPIQERRRKKQRAAFLESTPTSTPLSKPGHPELSRKRPFSPAEESHPAKKELSTSFSSSFATRKMKLWDCVEVALFLDEIGFRQYQDVSIPIIYFLASIVFFYLSFQVVLILVPDFRSFRSRRKAFMRSR
jgi:hypothetical protein